MVSSTASASAPADVNVEAPPAPKRMPQRQNGRPQVKQARKLVIMQEENTGANNSNPIDSDAVHAPMTKKAHTAQPIATATAKARPRPSRLPSAASGTDKKEAQVASQGADVTDVSSGFCKDDINAINDHYASQQRRDLDKLKKLVPEELFHLIMDCRAESQKHIQNMIQQDTQHLKDSIQKGAFAPLYNPSINASLRGFDPHVQTARRQTQMDISSSPVFHDMNQNRLKLLRAHGEALLAIIGPTPIDQVQVHLAEFSQRAVLMCQAASGSQPSSTACGSGFLQPDVSSRSVRYLDILRATGFIWVSGDHTGRKAHVGCWELPESHTESLYSWGDYAKWFMCLAGFKALRTCNHWME